MQQQNNPLHKHQRVQDAYGNKGRVLNPNIYSQTARVRMDNKLVRDYDISTIKPLTANPPEHD